MIGRKKRGRRPRFIGIYEIRCITSNRVYIGSSRDISIRWNSHIWDIITDKHVCKLLREEVRAYGISSIVFRILEVLDISTTPRLLRQREQQWMNQYTSTELLNTKRAVSRDTKQPLKQRSKKGRKRQE